MSDLISKVGSPLLVPSANKSGEPPLLNSNDVYDKFNDEIDGVIEGESISKIPSTIVLVDDDIHIIRLGEISESDIMDIIKRK